MGYQGQTLSYQYTINASLNGTRQGVGHLTSTAPIPFTEGQRLTVRLKGEDKLHRTVLVQVTRIDCDFTEAMMAQNEDSSLYRLPYVTVGVTVYASVISV